MKPSLTKRILKSGKPFILFHTYDASEKSIQEAIAQDKSMDLDISVDDLGKPYLGHSLEFYEKSKEEKPQNNMGFRDAINMVSKANIPVIVDCKDIKAWDLTDEVVSQIGPERCLVHIYANEMKFDYNFYDHDYTSEWLPARKLKNLKQKFPNVTTTASAKFLPSDLLINEKHKDLLRKIRSILKENNVDTVCLNVPDETMSDKILEFFLEKEIVPHVNIDGIDTIKLTKIFVGETNILASASNCQLLGY